MIIINHVNRILLQRDIAELVSFIAARVGRKAVRRSLPRMRVSIRLMMVLVAIAALLSHQVFERRNRFLRLARSHESQIALYLLSTNGLAACGRNSLGKPVTEGESNWHEAMGARYRTAAKEPWIPLGPDPELSSFENVDERRLKQVK